MNLELLVTNCKMPVCRMKASQAKQSQGGQTKDFMANGISVLETLVLAAFFFKFFIKI